jgi:predicted nucleic-acid-binding protein
MAAKGTPFLQTAEGLLLADLVLAEVVYVLESYYEVSRPRVAALVRTVLAFDAIAVVDESLPLRAAEVYELYRLDFADAYLVPCGERSGHEVIVSFDRSIGRVPSIDRVEPGDNRTSP